MGGCIAGLWCKGVAVLQSTEPTQLRSVRDAASFVMVPFSNRIGYGQLKWQGVQYSIERNFALEPHAIHGVGWERGWSVVQQSPEQVTLNLVHQADQNWPFGFMAEQRFLLEDNTIKMVLTINNTDERIAPVGLGWHPYFVKRKGAKLTFNSTGRWEMGEDKLPTVRTAHQGINQITDALNVDHCFDGWSGSVVLEDEVQCCTIRSNLNRLVVYTHTGLESIAIEPVSHVNNALQMATDIAKAKALGIQTLKPGESYECSMQITVEKK